MYQYSGSGLRLQSRLAAVGHECAAGGQCDVLQVGGDARATIDGNGSGVLVATGRVAHNFDPKIRLGYWRPWKRDTKQATFKQQGVRLCFVLRKVRAVGAVNGGEEWVFAAGGRPAVADKISRKA